jgi:hypothetical protein
MDTQELRRELDAYELRTRTYMESGAAVPESHELLTRALAELADHRQRIASQPDSAPVDDECLAAVMSTFGIVVAFTPRLDAPKPPQDAPALARRGRISRKFQRHDIVEMYELAYPGHAHSRLKHINRDLRMVGLKPISLRTLEADLKGIREYHASLTGDDASVVEAVKDAVRKNRDS